MKLNSLTSAAVKRWQLPACEKVLNSILDLIRAADRRKIIMRANLSILILFMAFMQASAESYGQKVTMSKKGASLKSIFQTIKKQTGYFFIYNSEDLTDSKVDVEVKNADLEEVMAACLKNLPFTFKIVKNNVLVRRADENLLENARPGSIAHPLSLIVQTEIRGKVTDETGGALAGVSIKVKGTKQGVTTDSNGTFRLSVEDQNATLVFSFIGFVSQEFSLNGKNQVAIIMREDQGKLDEIVVVGYGTQKKVNLTGAVDVVSGEKLTNRPAPNVALLLQGISPNLNVSLNSFGGEPGAVQKLQLRGIGSITGNSAPLILLDGVESNMNLIDPETVESISVLKDASSSAIYGSKAAFGVILITTKKGAKNQGVKIGYSNNVSFSAPIYVPDMESSLTYATVFNQASANAGLTPVFPAEQVERIKGYIDGTYKTEYDPNRPPASMWRGRWDGNANYNWTKEYYKKYAIHQKHNVNLSGGDAKNQYYVNAGIFDQPGTYSWGDDGYKRYNVLANITSKVADWVSFDFSTKYARNHTDVPLGVVGLDRTYTWSQFIDFWPTMPKYNIDGSIANPIILALEKGGRIVTENNDLWLNMGTELEPVKGWKTNLSYKYNVRWGSITQTPKPVPVTIPNGTMGNIGEAASGYRSELNQGQYSLLSLYTSYEKMLGKHALKGLVGYEQDVDNNRGLQGSKMNLISELVPSISTALGDYTLKDYMNHWATQGVFGRINYNYDEKYLLEVSGRYNGSSKFIPGSRWGFFPSFSAGYNISKEDFWKPLESYVNALKLRGSYGSLGNQNVPNNLYLPTIPIGYRRTDGSYSNPGYIIDNEVPIYAQMPGIVTDKLTWETITTLNLGLETSFLNRRLDLVFDWYNRVTSNMLGPSVQLPSVLGTGAPYSNNAKLSTKGFELTVAWNDRVSTDFSYNAKIVFSDSRTEILEYLNESGNIGGWYKGKMYGDIWGLTTDRILQTAGEAMPDQSYYYAKWGPGDIVYKDLDGNGVINEGKRTLNDHGDLSVIANNQPRYNFGVMAGFNWKGLDFSMFWQGVGKRDFLPVSSSEYFWGLLVNTSGSGLFKGGRMLDYWRPADETNLMGPNTNSYFPKPYFSNERNKNTQDQSRYVLNAAYIRLKNLQVGYTLPPKVLKDLFIKSARLYVSGENLLTFSKLPKMYEPETAVASNTRDGGIVDMGETYPINQMFSFGVNLTF